MNNNIYTVVFEGIDRCGKTTMRYFLGKKSNHTLITYDRGIITNIAWNKMLNRDVNYNLDMWKNTLFVHLTVDKEDWEIRCKLTNETPINYEQHTKMYTDAFKWFSDNGFYVLEFNTSHMTHNQISNNILAYLDTINTHD
jgi:hypothetical protein